MCNIAFELDKPELLCGVSMSENIGVKNYYGKNLSPKICG